MIFYYILNWSLIKQSSNLETEYLQNPLRSLRRILITGKADSAGQGFLL